MSSLSRHNGSGRPPVLLMGGFTVHQAGDVADGTLLGCCSKKRFIDLPPLQLTKVPVMVSSYILNWAYWAYPDNGSGQSPVCLVGSPSLVLGTLLG